MAAGRIAHNALASLLGALALALAGACASWARDRPCADPAGVSKQAADFVTAVVRQAPAVVTVLAEGSDANAADRWALSPWNSGRASATGFIIDTEGQVLTSAHVVSGAQTLSVELGGQRRLPADLVGLDRRTDIAVLKIGAANLPVAAIGSSARLCAGEWVAALGSPFGFDQSLTAGVVSANPRFLPGGSGVPLIQTDVALNPGSSGSPLFNERGEVVGVNSMAYSPDGGYRGLSFALPIDTAMRVVAELRSAGHVTRGQIGARTQAMTLDLAPAFGLDSASGALIVRVDPGSPAAAAGLRSGDVIVGIDGSTPMAHAEIQDRVAGARPGSGLTLSIWRRKAAMAVKVVVAESAPDLPKRAVASASHEVRLGLELFERTGKGAGGLLEPGLYVRSASGAAHRAGLRFGDLILAVNDVRVDGLTDLDAALASVADGETVALLVRRGAITSYVPVAPAVGLAH
ncbi:trypsin-like peptidase domain-containing protein [Variovorax sp. JS1663]|uniref:trypsin-like peptidase domain-containing protein n=1 Tax=Variovorax sp. JS1663 TaxID=1851577 RepID=UPI000B342914|nr:trypsin-like peptidase domain-containing protein [Variovorax sp. JS1663]OUM00931.1 trypsin [Variovorax sp. JS1663]